VAVAPGGRRYAFRTAVVAGGVWEKVTD
jgi:hypothetical protein